MSVKRLFSARSRAGIMFMLVALGGGGSVAHAAGNQTSVDVGFKGTLVTNCIVNDHSKTTVDFGDSVDIASIDGSSYDIQQIPFSFSSGCTSKAVTLTLKAGSTAPWNSSVVLMDKRSSLGVIVLSDGTALKPGTPFTASNFKTMKMQAVLAAKSDDLPDPGTFTGSATIELGYQ